MIIYENTKGGFIEDVRSGCIAQRIQREFERHNMGHKNDAEFRSWHNSLMYMWNVLDDRAIDNDVKLAVEYQVPLTSKRVDFLIAGADAAGANNVVVIELKQWEDSGLTAHPDVVTAFTGGANRAVCHPSYQAYSYAKIIENFNEDVYKERITLSPCAYLHNYLECNRSHIDNDFYKEAISCAPMIPILSPRKKQPNKPIRNTVEKRHGSSVPLFSAPASFHSSPPSLPLPRQRSQRILWLPLTRELPRLCRD